MSGKPKVPYEDLVAAYRELGTTKAAAAKFGVSDQAVYNALKALGQAVDRQSRRKVSDDEIIAAYRRLGDGNKVARELHTNAVYDVLRKHGIEADGHKKYVERARVIGTEESQKIVSDYEVGASASGIARKFECTTETILKALRRAGVVIRSTKPHMTLEEKHEAKRLYESGMTFKAVADATGRHVNTILLLMNSEFPEIVRSDSIGPGSPWWRGGRTTQGGYSMVWISPDDEYYSMAQRNGYVYEHRLVMARKLGRVLRDTETVHHKDGNRMNCDPDNLQLRQGKHGKHVVMRCRACGSLDIEHAEI